MRSAVGHGMVQTQWGSRNRDPGSISFVGLKDFRDPARVLPFSWFDGLA